MGITSACAEKRYGAGPACPVARNYLRMRGEEGLPAGCPHSGQELPPHARRRVSGVQSTGHIVGITSACAEKRRTDCCHRRIPGNYLRMRGEESVCVVPKWRCMELPPHARRRVLEIGAYSRLEGITSACAEKRVLPDHQSWRFRNYLRMRGEEPPMTQRPDTIKELPPHARRRGSRVVVVGFERGITSACAEKSATVDSACSRAWNYLRMRGEETVSVPYSSSGLELPPHARRRALAHPGGFMGHGITSACAEKSKRWHHFALVLGNYLRMRGEELLMTTSGLPDKELPPHARRRDCVTCENFNGQRRFVTLQPIRSRVTTCRPSLLYFCAVDQECSQRILALDSNRY